MEFGDATVTYWVHDYWSLYIRHALVGVGEATFTIFAPAVLSDFFPAKDRNRILSFFYLAIPVGAALGYLIGGQLGERYGWRTPFLVGAIPGLLIAAAYALFATEPVRGASEEGAEAGWHATSRGGEMIAKFSWAICKSGVSVCDARHGDAGVCDGWDFDLDANLSTSLFRDECR